MIKVENLVFNYPKNDVPTLKGINFDIEKGEVFGFLGPSGAGKSTAQKILYKIYNKYEGIAIVDGKNLSDWDNTYFEKIGVGFELPNHYLKLTGKENMDLFASFYSKKPVKSIASLFEMVDLSDAINKPVEAYSKGMKMRLNFIRAIQHDPDILFFDEPTTGLDPVSAHKVKQHILDLKAAGKTIFVTTHSMATADEICDRVSFIVDGKLQVTDTPKNLKKLYGKEALNVELYNGELREFPLKNLGRNEDFLSFIQEDDVKRMHTEEATLEEVFIQVTGKALKV
ncbi:ABC transporter ATP-binding protein [Putridiphycobacter roseus]|uniref:ABC transporter ATP-binding protein n=1 Tax=Putridiphycobacter roseus TaxID=2219161 RepID=A0A2W1NJW0_9FLAO|nr:ABC transporter ATP-binding protein [Putridiphycobacter roseus]PZE18246.1 ABC transporter ATP-binding protein [Putridiphycobacter roseus]